MPHKSAFLLSNVLSASECSDIINVSETIGFGAIKQGDATFRNCIWLADEATLNSRVFERCASLLPQEVQLSKTQRVGLVLPLPVCMPYVSSSATGLSVPPPPTPPPNTHARTHARAHAH